jgi:outer membrane protein assembly factor BamB
MPPRVHRRHVPSRRQILAGTGLVALGAGVAATRGTGGFEPYHDGEEAPDTTWWPQPTFDRIGSCYNPRSVGPRRGATERWSREIPGPSARPVVADGRAYLPTAEALLVVDAATGAELWREDGGDPPMWPRSVAVFDGTVYLTQVGDPPLLALDAETGDEQWTFAEAEYGLRPLLVDHERPSLYTGDGSGTVYALDPATGDVRWQADVFGTVSALVRGIPDLVVGTEAGEVYGLYQDDGRPLWRQGVPGGVSALATANGRGAFVSTFGGPTAELDGGRGGEPAWSTDVWSADSFVVAGRNLFAAGHHLVDVDVRGGDRLWTGGETAQCGPAAAGDTVYAASETHVTGYTVRGGLGVGGLRVDARRWSHPVEGRPEQGLAVADGAVFAITEGGGDDRSMAYALEEA